jgi:hypothetical protein
MRPFHYFPTVHPKDRSDLRGGVTRGTALAVKAMANLELKNYPAVAEATGQIIGSNNYALEPDYYQLFKIPGKLNSENILEFQYSDFGTAYGYKDNIPLCHPMARHLGLRQYRGLRQVGVSSHQVQIYQVYA